MTTSDRRPGVFFDVQAPTPAAALPRMDVAAFVGFAAAGPLHTPVAVEDVVRFRDLFGPDLPLATDVERGTLEASRLGPAVEAFFRNGGRRCWVVRVADRVAAAVARFPLPGLLRGDTLAGAEIVARSAGAWADAYRVGTALERSGLRVVADAAQAGSPALSPGEPGAAVVLQTHRGAVVPGDLIELGYGADGPLMWGHVDTVTAAAGGLSVTFDATYWFARSLGSPPADPAGPVPLDAEDGITTWHHWHDRNPDAAPAAYRLTFELLVWRERELIRRLGGLGFSERHPRFWAQLPSDETLFSTRVGRADPPLASSIAELRREAAALPRFPLAGPPHEAAAALYLPIGMAESPDAALARAAFEAPGTPLLRNGLASFDARLFLDPDLTAHGADSLLREAEHKCYLRQQALDGIHSLLPIEEVAMVAVPDAAQPGWSRVAPPAGEVLDAPELAAIGPGVLSDEHRIEWSAVRGATSYVLERSPEPDLSAARVMYEGERASVTVVVPADCTRTVFYRVRALKDGEAGPWSNTRSRGLGRPEFSPCGLRVPPALQLTLARDPVAGRPAEASWTGAVDATLDFQLEEARDTDFRSARTAYRGSATTVLVPVPSDARCYYRVRALKAGRPGPWSNTVSLAAGDRSAETMLSPLEYSPVSLLAVHRALLRFCAARADLVAVLSLPRHYRPEDVLAHVAQLDGGEASGADGHASMPAPLDARGVSPLTPGEERVLGFGALYYPWLATAPLVESGTLTWEPPDGPVCGTVARTALDGAWLAPANVPLSRVVALDPAIDAGSLRALGAAGVNVIQADVRGFVALSADTLSPASEAKPLNVRQLLILLRRVARREGQAYVFEPNDVDFRSRVTRRFDFVLADLYLRGAFAGTAADEAYRVVADQSVNTAQTLEQGLFVVELRVAPSRPLAFLTVRLVQTGPAELEVEER